MSLHGSTWPHECYVCSSTKFSQYPARQSWNVCCTRIVFIKLVVLSCSETYSKQGIMFVNRPYWPYCRIVFGNSPFNLVNEQHAIKACMSVRILYFTRFIRLQRSSSLSSTVKSVECIHVNGEHSKQLSREPWIVRAPVWSLCSYKPTGACPTGSL